MKRILSILCLACLMIGLLGACGAQPAVSEPSSTLSSDSESSPAPSDPSETDADASQAPADPPEMDVAAPQTPLTAENTRWLGRTWSEDGKTRIVWTDSGFELRFKGTGIQAHFGADTPYDDGIQPYIWVYVDGELFGDKIMISGEGWYSLAYNLEPGEHTVKVVKLTEAKISTFWVSDVRFYDNGELLDPPPAPERKIEFIGDSITCGHTIERSRTDADVFSNATQNGMLTYAAVCAGLLDADFNCFAISGWAVYQGPDDGSGARLAIPSIYHLTDPVSKRSEPWDFSRFTPDVVVVALGTNDSSYISQGDTEAQTFVAKYKEFLSQLRGYYPNATIVCTVGMVNPAPYAYIHRAVDEMNDANIYAHQESWYGGSHPIVSDHQKAGEELADFIADIKDWN